MKLSINRTRIVTCIVLLCTLYFSNTYAQQKRMLSPDDYKLWESSGKIGKSELSGDGNWLAYRIKGPEVKNITYLKNIKSGIQHSFNNTVSTDHYDYTNPNFSADNKWFAIVTGDSLNLLNLSSGKKYSFPSVSGFRFTHGGRYLLSYNDKDTTGKTVWLKDLKTLKQTTIKKVKEYSLNPDKNILAIISEEHETSKVKIITLKAPLHSSELASVAGKSFKDLTWNQTGTSLAFYAKKNGKDVEAIYSCKNIINKPVLKILDPLATKGIPEGSYMVFGKLHLSDDGEVIFFNLSKQSKDSRPTVQSKPGIQIWRTEDKQVPPNQNYIGYPADNYDANPVKKFVWWPEKELIRELADREHPKALVTGDQKKALLYNEEGYLPKYKYIHSYMDIYIKDLLTGEKKLIAKKVKNYGSLIASPKGKYVAYYKEKQWWIYNIYNDQHKCITLGLNINFENEDLDITGVKPSYGNPGWLEDDSRIILYDKFDIWMLNADGTKPVRITDGQKTNTTFRVYDNGIGKNNPGDMPFWFNSKLYHSDGILITSLNNTTLDQGFWNWSQSSGLHKIVEKGQKLRHLSEGKYKMPFLFIESGFDVAPRLMLQHPSGKEQLIYQTDSFKTQFHWGKSELINYKGIDGKPLKGALFYPANYIPGKKYPMVVEIYEKRSKELHDYIVPSESIDNSSHEINPTTYTSEGYFVLFPDIYYRLNDPGISAKECVVAATEKVIEKGLVDKDKIGLIGHSFGGYETCLIITQTNLFKAAIAGSAITDLPDWYLSISESFGVNISRVEEDQHRMQTPFYGSDFRRNSPMDNIANMNTPLMLWTGDKDANVDWLQSRKFQIASWRLGKKSTLVVYPGEDHVLADPVNQKDLATREKNWFDHYLKGEKAAEWMLNKVKSNE